MALISAFLGFPRIGVHRELKKALESYWNKKISKEELENTGRDLRRRHWQLAKDAGIDHIPCNDFSYYDHILDMAVAVGAVPERYMQLADPWDRYFAMARGYQKQESGIDIPALEMTKWFDTNYHYIVPELASNQIFQLDASKLLGELAEARALGLKPRPVIPGPVSFLLLSKMQPEAAERQKTIDFLDELLPVYEQLFTKLADLDVEWVQLDEPCLVLELSPEVQAAYQQSLARLASFAKRPKLMLTTYFDSIVDNLPLLADAGVEGIHIDLVRAPEQLAEVLKHCVSKSLISLGLIDARNIWRTDLDQAAALLRQAAEIVSQDQLMVASSCSLLHVPVDLETETKLDAELKSWLSFASQKLREISELARHGIESPQDSAFFLEARSAIARRASAPGIQDPHVRHKIKSITPDMLRRTAYTERVIQQRKRFQLPVLPTTTIGSFPQTAEIRNARAAWRAGRMDDQSYQGFLQKATQHCIEKQEAVGLDVLVHGEFERNDMVEYFGEKMAGFAFTENGWVQSYGSRCVKPPILYGDVSRPSAMTVEWTRYAQSLTKKPVKGMLTGPVTILQWSFVRNDQPRSETCKQIALALREEVLDLEAAGIGIIQVDEPAIREGLPLKRSDWQAYLNWAVDAFRLATAGLREDTQVHTHMCYSEFADILDAIAALDADVLSIETSRSKMELLGDFARFRYPNEVGPGVYDIHSPRVPTLAEMEDLLVRAAEVLPPQRLWVNPDCGLKTRDWPEVEAALGLMVKAAGNIRAKIGMSPQ